MSARRRRKASRSRSCPTPTISLSRSSTSGGSTRLWSARQLSTSAGKPVPWRRWNSAPSRSATTAASGVSSSQGRTSSPGSCSTLGSTQRARPAEEEGQVRGQLLGRVLVRRDADQRCPELAREPGEDVPPRGALEPGGPDPGARAEQRAHPSQRIGRGGHLRHRRGRRGVRLGHRGRGAFKTAARAGQPRPSARGTHRPGNARQVASRCRDAGAGKVRAGKVPNTSLDTS